MVINAVTLILWSEEIPVFYSKQLDRCIAGDRGCSMLERMRECLEDRNVPGGRRKARREKNEMLKEKGSGLHIPGTAE